MATQPPPNLPLFYKNLQPLSSSLHAGYTSRPSDKAPYLATANAIPLTIDEFISAQRHYPIVFSSGEVPVPLALMGLNEGVNVFIDEEGKARTRSTYRPMSAAIPICSPASTRRPRSSRSASIRPAS